MGREANRPRGPCRENLVGARFPGSAPTVATGDASRAEGIVWAMALFRRLGIRVVIGLAVVAGLVALLGVANARTDRLCDWGMEANQQQTQCIESGGRYVGRL